MTALGYAASGAGIAALGFFLWELWVSFRSAPKLRRHVATSYPSRVVTFERRGQAR